MHHVRGSTRICICMLMMYILGTIHIWCYVLIYEIRRDALRWLNTWGTLEVSYHYFHRQVNFTIWGLSYCSTLVQFRVPNPACVVFLGVLRVHSWCGSMLFLFLWVTKMPVIMYSDVPSSHRSIPELSDTVLWLSEPLLFPILHRSVEYIGKFIRIQSYNRDTVASRSIQS